jgi:hypothetical protein
VTQSKTRQLGESTSIARKLYSPDAGRFNTYRRGLRQRTATSQRRTFVAEAWETAWCWILQVLDVRPGDMGNISNEVGRVNLILGRVLLFSA